MTHIVVDEQRKAYRTEGPRVAIVAGAGSGKTTVLVRRVEWLLHRGVDPQSILVCTFTVAAAEELRERLDRRDLQITTLHGWAHHELRRHHALVGLTADFSVYDAVDAEAIASAVAADLGLKVRERQAVMKHPAAEQLYRQRIREANGIDYDTLLSDLRRLLDHPTAGPDVRSRARHVLVDEGQDLDDQQHDLLDALAPDSVTMIADPRQTLYGWRGARPERFAAFAASSNVATLAINRRSVVPIVRLGNAVFDGTDYPPMEDHPDRAQVPPDLQLAQRGVEVILGERAEAATTAVRRLLDRGYPSGQIAVLGRTWASLWQVYEALKERDIPGAYLGPDRSPWETEAGRTIARWCQLVLNPTDDNLAALVLAAAMPGIDIPRARAGARATRLPLLKHAVAERWLPEPLGWQEPTQLHATRLIDYATGASWTKSKACGWVAAKLTSPSRRTLRSFRWWWTQARTIIDSKEFAAPDVVTLTTIHGAKGLAWRAVVLLDCDSGRFRGTPEKPSDDRQALYVAITRARDALILTRTVEHETRGVVVPTEWPRYIPCLP